MISAILALLPSKDWFYGAIIATAIGGFTWYTIHERDAGEAAVRAADQRTAMVAQAKDLAIEAAANTQSSSTSLIYEKAVAIPAVADLGIVCNSPGGSAMPKAAGDQPKDPDPAVVGSVRSFDPSGDILTLLRNDDAQINALIDTVNTLVFEMHP